MLGIDWGSLFSPAGVVAVVVGAVGKTLFDKWFGHRLDQRLERQRYEQRMREQAAKIAEVAAVGPFLPSGGEDDETFRRLRQLAYELLLVLPDNVYREFVAGMARKGGKNDFTALLAVKEHLQGSPTNLTAEDVLFFHPKGGEGMRKLDTKQEPLG